MEVLDAARMRRADEITIKKLKTPSLVLMENAGRLVAAALLEKIPDVRSRRVIVLAGPGNNGGDGFVAARHLLQASVGVTVYLVGARRRDLTGDAAAMADAWLGVGRQLVEAPNLAAWKSKQPNLGPDDVVVDALFGAGLARPLKGLAADAVEVINRSGAHVVAVDVPSGLSASHWAIPGPAVQADLTVTFVRPKPAHLLPPAEACCGDLLVVDIGIPDTVVQEVGADLHWVTPADAKLLLPEREPEDHKGRFGHVLVAAGGVGKAGAAALVGWGALRVGAGLCTVAAPAPARPEVAGFAPELMTEPLPADAAGVLGRGAADAILGLARERSALALGPGLGRAGATPAEIRRAVAGCPVAIVLDADGVNAFAGGRLAALRRRQAPLVLTPHPGEAARLSGVATPEIQADRVGWARRLAEKANAVCVLKGHRTVVAAPDGQAFVNSTGNPGMASGGMGDALTGMIAGLIAQELAPLESAILGVFLHGLAADLAVGREETQETLTATALLRSLPAAFRLLAAEDEAEDGLPE